MKLAIRVDASIHMGTGHVMRCLTLANEVSRQGAAITFICRKLSDGLSELISANGHDIKLLPRVFSQTNKNDVWLEGSEEQDAQDTTTILEYSNWDWVIVDHYGLGIVWENIVAQYCGSVFVIDDLADREHNCRMLLDQTIERNPSDYRNLVPIESHLLVGAGYSLLRPDFTKYRESSLRRRENAELKTVLISMGGTDPNNVSSRVLDILHRAGFLNTLELNIVVGSGNPWIQQLSNNIKKVDRNMRLLIDVQNMAELLSKTDLVIGAAGTSAWERCCMGVPTLLVVLADNQSLIAENLARVGAVVNLENPESDEFHLRLIEALTQSGGKGFLEKMSKNASIVTDGSGVKLISSKLMNMV